MVKVSNVNGKTMLVVPEYFFVVIHQKLLMLESWLISCENAKLRHFLSTHCGARRWQSSLKPEIEIFNGAKRRLVMDGWLLARDRKENLPLKEAKLNSGPPRQQDDLTTKTYSLSTKNRKIYTMVWHSLSNSVHSARECLDSLLFITIR